MNHYGVLLNMSVDKLYFLPGRYDHPEALTAVLPAKDIPEFNLSSDHWCTATSPKTLVSPVKVSSVKTSPVKRPSGKLSLSYLPLSQWPDWQYFWRNSNFPQGNEISLCVLSDAWEPLFSDTSYGSHQTETEIAYWKMNAAVNLTEIEAAVPAWR